MIRFKLTMVEKIVSVKKVNDVEVQFLYDAFGNPAAAVVTPVTYYVIEVTVKVTMITLTYALTPYAPSMMAKTPMTAGKTVPPLYGMNLNPSRRPLPTMAGTPGSNSVLEALMKKGGIPPLGGKFGLPVKQPVMANAGDNPCAGCPSYGNCG